MPIDLPYRVTISALIALMPTSPLLAQPAPPPLALEFFNPTTRTHGVAAKCQMASLDVRWVFIDRHAKIERFVFSGKSAPEDQIAIMNGWLSEIDGDVFIGVECGNDGAMVSLIQANLAGTGNAKQIKFTWQGGKATLFARYRFPVR